MITIATYNILHGYHADLILKNIRLLMDKGSDVICLQEAEISFEPVLAGFLSQGGFHSWKAEYIHVGVAGNLALLWNSSRAEFLHFKPVSLPTVPPVLMQRIKRHSDILQRMAFEGTFMIDQKTVRITNVHLAWEGGQEHRLRQLAYLKSQLAGEDTRDADVIAGDFNTFAFGRSRLIQQRQVENVLGHEFENVLPALPWTCDISYTAPQDKWETVAWLCRVFNIKLRSRLDYVFARGLKSYSSEMLDVPGSDHRPLVATFEIENSSLKT